MHVAASKVRYLILSCIVEIHDSLPNNISRLFCVAANLVAISTNANITDGLFRSSRLLSEVLESTNPVKTNCNSPILRCIDHRCASRLCRAHAPLRLIVHTLERLSDAQPGIDVDTQCSSERAKPIEGLKWCLQPQVV